MINRWYESANARPIIHITECFGGVETYLRLLIKYPPWQGRQIHLVIPRRNSLSDYFESQGGTIHIVPMLHQISPMADAKAIVALYKIFKKLYRPIIHLHSSKAGALGRIAAAMLPRNNKPVVIYTPHAFYYLGKKGIGRNIFLLIERFLRLLTDYLVATSPSEAFRAIVEVGYSDRKVVTMTNAVEIPPEQDDSYSHNNKSKSIVMVGRLCYQKNIDMFFDVVKILQLENNLKFILIGIGHYKEDNTLLEKMLREHGLERNDIDFIPWIDREQLMAYINEAAVCVLTSRYESFGYVLAEAGARGVPTIGMKVDGIKDIIIHGETGYLVEENNSIQFAKYLKLLANNYELARNMGCRARERIKVHFNIETRVQEFSKFYARISDN